MASMLPWRPLLYIRDILVEWRLLGARSVFHVRGQGPKIRWKKNEGSLKRAIEQAVAISRKNGVDVPEDVEFFEAEPGELEESLNGFLRGQRFETARGPRVTEHQDGRIYWQDHYNFTSLLGTRPTK